MRYFLCSPRKKKQIPPIIPKTIYICRCTMGIKSKISVFVNQRHLEFHKSPKPSIAIVVRSSRKWLYGLRMSFRKLKSDSISLRFVARIPSSGVSVCPFSGLCAIELDLTFPFYNLYKRIWRLEEKRECVVTRLVEDCMIKIKLKKF